jgi:hypothetical protein
VSLTRAGSMANIIARCRASTIFMGINGLSVNSLERQNSSLIVAATIRDKMIIKDISISINLLGKHGYGTKCPNVMKMNIMLLYCKRPVVK